MQPYMQEFLGREMCTAYGESREGREDIAEPAQSRYFPTVPSKSRESYVNLISCPTAHHETLPREPSCIQWRVSKQLEPQPEAIDATKLTNRLLRATIKEL